MTRPLARLLTLMALGCPALAQELPVPRFTTVAVCIDSGSEPLAAWQVELSVKGGAADIVGIEGGERPFDTPAYHDAAALRRGRIVLASFTTDERIRSGLQRVSTVHVTEVGGEITYSVTLEAAGNRSGDRITAKAWPSKDDCKHGRTP